MNVPEAVSRAAVLADVSRERDRQERIHKLDSLIHRPIGDGLANLVEEVGEVGRAIRRKKDVQNLRDELIQVAAVAVAMVQAIDRAHG